MAKTKKENKKKLVLALLIVLLLALAVGYAAFSDVLNISGTAKIASNTSFDLQFTSASTVVHSEGCTATVTPGADTNGDANDKLTVSVQNLAYPGAGAQIKAVIKNFGSMPAKLTSLAPTNIAGNTNAIKITGLEGYVANEVIQPGASCEVTFTVYWDSTVTTLDNTKAGEDGNNFEFSLGLTYEQFTTAITLTNSHTDVASS